MMMAVEEMRIRSGSGRVRARLHTKGTHYHFRLVVFQVKPSVEGCQAQESEATWNGTLPPQSRHDPLSQNGNGNAKHGVG